MGGTEVLATGVALWRAAWFRTLAATDHAEMFLAHADVLDAAGNAFIFSTRGRGVRVTNEQFTGSLDDALKDRLDAARKLQRWGC